MKGPFERLKYDLRRLWECPLCKRRERSDGTVTSRFCVCPGKGGPENQRTAMKLLEESGHRTVPEFQYKPTSEAESVEVASPQELCPTIPEPSASFPETNPSSGIPTDS